jgi:hypothetical protein
VPILTKKYHLCLLSEERGINRTISLLLRLEKSFFFVLAYQSTLTKGSIFLLSHEYLGLLFFIFFSLSAVFVRNGRNFAAQTAL